jgi:hypothetical protein
MPKGFCTVWENSKNHKATISGVMSRCGIYNLQEDEKGTGFINGSE